MVSEPPRPSPLSGFVVIFSRTFEARAVQFTTMGMAQTGNIIANRQFLGAPGLASARAICRPRPCRLVISNAVGTQTAKRTTKKEALKDARDDVRELIKSKHCNPILVRVAWHDSGTYDKARSSCKGPYRRGRNASLCLRCCQPGRTYGF